MTAPAAAVIKGDSRTGKPPEEESEIPSSLQIPQGKRAFGAMGPLAGLLGGYVGLAIVVHSTTELDLFAGFSAATIGADLALAAAVTLLGLAVVGLRRRVIPGHVGAAKRVWVAGGYVLGYLLFLIPFLGFKVAIPEIVAFGHWDRAFFELDRLLHGTDPWRLLQPVIGYPPLTDVIDQVYYAWFPIKIGMLAGVALTPPSRLRARFLFCFFGAWVFLGTILAIAFSSAGPCYYDSILPGDPYDPLFDYLARVDARHGLQALVVQGQLWASLKGIATEDPVVGISAMPSLHVALPILYTIWGFRARRWAGWFFAMFLLLTFVGSVHLGWHYAVDGYASVVGMLGLWWWSGKLYEERVLDRPV